MPKNLKRYYQAWKLRKQGLKLKEIGEIMGLSKERVREMANYLEHRMNKKFPPLPKEIVNLIKANGQFY